MGLRQAIAVKLVKFERGCAWRCELFRQAVSSTVDGFEALGAWQDVSPARRFGSCSA